MKRYLLLFALLFLSGCNKTFEKLQDGKSEKLRELMQGEWILVKVEGRDTTLYDTTNTEMALTVTEDTAFFWQSFPQENINKTLISYYITYKSGDTYWQGMRYDSNLNPLNYIYYDVSTKDDTLVLTKDSAEQPTKIFYYPYNGKIPLTWWPQDSEIYDK